MDFIQNTIGWVKGELFEASMILLFGILTVIGGFMFWKIGTTPGAKALLFPLIITGVIYAAIGGSMRISNQKRMVEYQQSYRKNEKEFIQFEKKRVEDFQYGYTISKIVATICFTITLLVFWVTKNPTWQGIGLGLTYFALTGLVVDYFSQERADIYYQAILSSLK